MDREQLEIYRLMCMHGMGTHYYQPGTREPNIRRTAYAGKVIDGEAVEVNTTKLLENKR